VLSPVATGQDDEVGFGKGPINISLLLSSIDHVTCKLWEGEDLGKLKLVSHKHKISLGSFIPKLRLRCLRLLCC